MQRRSQIALCGLMALCGCVAPAPQISRRVATPASPVSRAAPAPATHTASTPPGTPSSKPASLALVAPLPNLNDFDRVANGGFDPGWRVGYDTAWIVQLPPIPAGPWKKAFLGAKLGRAKLQPIPGRPPWEKRRITGEIDIAAAQEPIWPHSRRFFLAKAEDIPLEGDPENALSGVGEARWYWTEIPLSNLSSDHPNFIVLFSPSSSLEGPDRSPVLAAGTRPAADAPNAWMSANRRGQPPLGPGEAFESPVKTFSPAVAIKLVPDTEAPVSVSIGQAPAAGWIATAPFQLGASVAGEDIARAWVEVSTDTKKWSAWGTPLLTPPYLFTIAPQALPSGEVWLRIEASDFAEDRGISDSRKVIVPNKR